jgi:glycosyltransferase involved in cell wall biosynthesis
MGPDDSMTTVDRRSQEHGVALDRNGGGEPAGPPLVSVVTPVYNGAEFLRECIDSVLAQTYPHWDLTIVNNCSTDETLKIAEEYAARDPRIRVRTNAKFVRGIENYNNAVRQLSAASKYCKVLAADDWLFPTCLEEMVRLGEDQPTVAVIGSYGLREREMESVGLPYPSRRVPGRDVCRARLLGGENEYYFGAPTSVLYRADVVRSREPFYNESNLHSDSEVCLDILKDHDFGFVHQVLTFRRERDGSLMSFSRRVNTYLPMLLLELTKFGPVYLSNEEQARRIREHLTKYYRYLGKESLKLREAEFWKYHRYKLADLGYPLSRTRVAIGAVQVIVDFVCNPKATLEKAASKLSPRLRPSSQERVSSAVTSTVRS